MSSGINNGIHWFSSRSLLPIDGACHYSGDCWDWAGSFHLAKQRRDLIRSNDILVWHLFECSGSSSSGSSSVSIQTQLTNSQMEASGKYLTQAQ
jgi:hypothetical protein